MKKQYKRKNSNSGTSIIRANVFNVFEEVRVNAEAKRNISDVVYYNHFIKLLQALKKQYIKKLAIVLAISVLMTKTSKEVKLLLCIPYIQYSICSPKIQKKI